MTHPFFAGTEHPRIFAHRGFVSAESAAAGVVENSFAAVSAAHAEGVDYVESDCQLTSDGVVVLFHDDDLRRVTGDPRLIREVTARELEKIMAERGGLITLEQALESFPETRFNLDAKAEDVAKAMGKIVAPHAERVLVASFSDSRREAVLTAARHAGGHPATSAGSATLMRVLLATWTRIPALVGRSLRGLDALQIPERQGAIRVLSPRLVRAAHAHGVEIHVWTVNDIDTMRRLRDMDVDGIVTDRADLALEALR